MNNFIVNILIILFYNIAEFSIDLQIIFFNYKIKFGSWLS